MVYSRLAEAVAGANAAGSSNLAMGPHHPAPTIDLYMDDSGVSSLGHRRWLLDPPYLSAGIGHAGAWNCTYVMTHGNDLLPAYVAFPAPGPRAERSARLESARPTTMAPAITRITATSSGALR